MNLPIRLFKVCIALVFAGSACVASACADDAADAIFHVRTIYTLEPGVEGDTIAVRAGRIVAIGSESDVKKLDGPATRHVRAPEGFMLPGLIDAHGHMAGLGSFGLGLLDLSSATSFDDVVAAVAEKVNTAKKGAWILGGRWDHESWPDHALPTNRRLSEVAPDNPVWLRRVDGHAGIANAAALKIAGVTKDSQAPAGGEIIRDAGGELTGVFIDNAMDAIARHARGSGQSTADLLLKAQEMCLSVGLTGVHDAGISPDEAAVYQRLADDGRLKLRVFAMISAAYAKDWFAKHPTPPEIGPRFRVGGVKLYADGAMGSRGALLLEPYSDRPTAPDGKPYLGLPVSTPEFMAEIAALAGRHGYQACTHAIGDRANREVLDAYAPTLAALAREGRDARFRIEHAQLLSPADLPRFAKLHVIASMQPTHCTSDLRWVDERVGPRRARGAYAWKSLLESGAVLAFGSDFPVESQNPFPGLYAAVTRQTPDGKPPGGWHPEQRLSRDEALRAFTLGAAYASREESLKGSLKPGKLADFVIIDRDYFNCPERDIAVAKVLITVIDGEIVYEARGHPNPTR